MGLKAAPNPAPVPRTEKGLAYMGERGYWIKEQNQSKNDPKAASSIQREKTAACSRLKNAQLRSKRPLRSRQTVVNLGCQTASLNTTQSRSVFWKAKNGSTSLQNVAFVYVNLEGFDFMNASNFNILSINGCQLGVGVGLLQETQLRQNTELTRSKTLGQCSLSFPSCGDRGFRFFLSTACSRRPAASDRTAQTT